MRSLRRSPVRRFALVLLVAGATVPLLPTESPACSLVGAEILEIRGPDTASDGEAPGELSVSRVLVVRGRGGQAVGCHRTAQSSCDDLGSILLELEPALDPDSRASEVGYVVEVVRGRAPDGLNLLGVPQLPTREDGATVVRLSWIDGATDEQEPLVFWVTLRAIDADGHEGPQSEAVAVVDSRL